MHLRSPAELDGPDWAFVLVALALAWLHLYLGLFAPAVPGRRAAQFVAIGLVLLAGPLVYFTDYWRPILYLVGATVAGSLGVLWVLDGMAYALAGLLAGVAEAALVLLGVYLFLREERFAADGRVRR